MWEARLGLRNSRIRLLNSWNPKVVSRLRRRLRTHESINISSHAAQEVLHHFEFFYSPWLLSFRYLFPWLALSFTLRIRSNCAASKSRKNHRHPAPISLWNRDSKRL